MGRQSSSPDSYYFENIYQLPFFVSASSPLILFVSSSGSRVAAARAQGEWIHG